MRQLDERDEKLETAVESAKKALKQQLEEFTFLIENKAYEGEINSAVEEKINAAVEEKIKAVVEEKIKAVVEEKFNQMMDSKFAEINQSVQFLQESLNKTETRICLIATNLMKERNENKQFRDWTVEVHKVLELMKEKLVELTPREDDRFTVLESDLGFKPDKKKTMMGTALESLMGFRSGYHRED